MPTKSKSRITTRLGAGVRPLVQRRLPSEIPPTHPGEMLLEEFLKPLAISQSAFAIRLGVSFPRLNEIIRAKRGVTPDTALRLARVTGMSADFRLAVGLGSPACLAIQGRAPDRKAVATSPCRVAWACTAARGHPALHRPDRRS